ncbi:hypothetical protein HBB16_09885 [Pseudonocardia sp. MCCB 268]|nr:hypothetical protein [Pseudonocardia cytotoxica]
MAEQRSATVLTRSRQIGILPGGLQTQIADRLPAFAALVDENDDYATYTVGQREQVANVVGLVTTTVSVMATPLVDELEQSPISQRRSSPMPNSLADLSGVDRADGAVVA